jgi:hypothetical protein
VAAPFQVPPRRVSSKSNGAQTARIGIRITTSAKSASAHIDIQDTTAAHSQAASTTLILRQLIQVELKVFLWDRAKAPNRYR